MSPFAIVVTATVSISILVLVIVLTVKLARARAEKLLTPAFINSIVREQCGSGHRRVYGSNVGKISHCGDGTASTTDRIVVQLDWGDENSELPKRAIFKCILLPRYLRMGATPTMIGFATHVANALRVVRLDWLIYHIVNWYTFYLPHAPDPMYENETNFYRFIRPELKNIEAPRAYGTLIDPANCQFSILMEDLSLRFARFPNATEELSLKHITSLLDSLSTLHAQYWESDRFNTDLAWLPTPSSGGMHYVFSTIGFGLIRDHIQSNEFEQIILRPLNLSVDELWAGLKESERVLTEHPITLCHGDTHIQNTYILPDGTVGLLDWQLTLKGSWARDVAYILGTALAPAKRRRHEKHLLKEYMKLLGKKSVESVPSAEDAWRLYCQSMAWGLVIGWLICPPNNYGKEITSANLRRLVAACVDLKTFESLGVN